MFLKKILFIFVFVFLLDFQVKASVVKREVSKPKHQYGSPSNILGFEQVGNETKVVVDQIALDAMFLHPEVKNRKVVVVSIIGAFRKGKSFFMDYCLRFMYANYKSVNFMTNPTNNSANWMGQPDEPLSGFSWKSGGTRDTRGIILWSDFFLATDAIGEKIAIILMDTQGLFDSKTSPADNSRIFALGTLISSMQIFNLNDVIQENQLQYLQLATDFAKLAAKDNQQSNETKPFQNLLFLIRDWSYPDDEPFGFVGGNSYLMKNLAIEENQHESLSSVREYISSSYDNISCCLLPFPGKKVTRADYNGCWSGMDDDFKVEFKSLIEKLLHQTNLVVKKINNHELTADELKSYIEVYFKVFQSNEQVGAQSLYEITVAEQMNILIEKGLQTYKEHLVNAKLPNITDFVEQINAVHHDSKLISIDQFVKAQKMGSSKQHTKFQKELETKIEATFSEWKANAIENHEKLLEEIRKTKAKEEENRILAEEKRKLAEDNKRLEEEKKRLEEEKKRLEEEKKRSEEEKKRLEEENKRLEEEKKRSEEEKKRSDLSLWAKTLIIVGSTAVAGPIGGGIAAAVV